MAEQPLGPYFHSSTADLQPGDMVWPSAKTGRSNWDYSDDPTNALGEWRRHKVFMTNSGVDGEQLDDPEEEAWYWGDLGQRAGARHDERLTAYEIEPHGEMVDLHGGEYAADSARVVRRIDIPPPDPELDPDGRQGTLPNHHWWTKQYRPRWMDPYDSSWLSADEHRSDEVTQPDYHAALKKMGQQKLPGI